MNAHPAKPFWLTAFFDFAPADHHAGTTFWSGVTGYAVSASRGGHGEFATLVPEAGDDYLRIQRLDAGPSRLHLDLHVADPRAAADHARTLGATEVADYGHVIMTSPGGLTICFVSHAVGSIPGPRTWPGGHRSLAHHVCIDIPASSWEVESRFWAAVVDAPLELVQQRQEFGWLRPTPRLWLGLLLQRQDSDGGEVSAHLDYAADDRPAEVARHLALGAEKVLVERWWTVLRDPVGQPYCIVDQNPDPSPNS